MARAARVILICLTALMAWSCSSMSPQIKNEAMAPVRFDVLTNNIEQYVGKTVILGGYILETKNMNEVTRIRVLQSPLGFRDEPGSKDASEGRFLIVYEGFLDPEIYAKNRKITVAGIVKGFTEIEEKESKYTYLTIQNRELYLWPLPRYSYDYPYYYRYYPYHYYPYFPYPYYWYPYRFYWYPFGLHYYHYYH